MSGKTGEVGPLMAECACFTASYSHDVLNEGLALRDVMLRKLKAITKPTCGNGPRVNVYCLPDKKPAIDRLSKIASWKYS